MSSTRQSSPDERLEPGRLPPSHRSRARGHGTVPRLRRHGAILHSRDGAIDNVRLVAALRRTLERSSSVAVSVGDPVRRIQFGGGVPTVTTASGARVSAATVILAAGAWAANVDGLPRRLPVVPLKGQMLALGATTVRHAVMGVDIYLVPRGPETLVGATVEHAGFDTETNAAAIDQLRRGGRGALSSSFATHRTRACGPAYAQPRQTCSRSSARTPTSPS